MRPQSGDFEGETPEQAPLGPLDADADDAQQQRPARKGTPEQADNTAREADHGYSANCTGEGTGSGHRIAPKPAAARGRLPLCGAARVAISSGIGALCSGQARAWPIVRAP